MPFYTSKDALLHCKRASFRTQKGVDGKRKGKEIYKNNPRNAASPSPSRGRGCAWRDIECYVFGRWKEEDLKLKVHGLILKGQMFRGQKYALSHADRLSVNSEIRSLKHTIHLSIIRKFVVFSTQFIYLLIRKFVGFILQITYLLIRKFVVFILQITYLSIRKSVVWRTQCVRLGRRLFDN